MEAPSQLADAGTVLVQDGRIEVAELPNFIRGCDTVLDDDGISVGNRGELVLGQREHDRVQIAIGVAAPKELERADLQNHNLIAYGKLVIAEELDLDTRVAPERVRGLNRAYTHYRPHMHCHVPDQKGPAAELAIEIDVADDPRPAEAECDVLDRRVRRQTT